VPVASDRFAELDAQVQRQVADVLEEGAREVARAAQASAPVLTGSLRGSIEAVPVGTLRARTLVGVRYGVFQELGTAKMSANPYLRPALDRVWPRVLQNLEGLI